MTQTMDDGPPAGQFDAPPNDRGRAPVRRQDTQADEATEMRAFYLMLDAPKFSAELKRMLPDTITVDAFIRTAKTAVQNNPKLLNPEWRGSLLRSITKAAAQGLLPDGKHGALIPRQDNAAGGKYQVCWQPMVWGITQLGRRAGALKKLTAHIVFDGEEFEVLGGAEDRIHHKINPVIVEKAYLDGATPAKFFEHVAFAYCIITAPDGTVTWRYMTRARIMRVKAASKAANGPWNGAFFDEMILKTVILFTAKHIDLDGDTPETRRFREAMETDMEADLDGEAIEVEASAVPALPAPSSAMDRLEQQLTQSLTETVTGTTEPAAVEQATAEQPLQQQAQTDEATKEQQPKQKAEAPNADCTAKAFADKLKADILEAATVSPDGETALVNLLGARKHANGLKKLHAEHKALYDDVVASFTRSGVVERIGGLQDKFVSLYDDIIAASQKQAA